MIFSVLIIGCLKYPVTQSQHSGNDSLHALLLQRCVGEGTKWIRTRGNASGDPEASISRADFGLGANFVDFEI